MHLLLRHRNFALLWFGGLISMSGDWMLLIALPIYVYELTGSTLATGIMFMVGRLPPLLLGSVAGVFVDRWDRRRTMIVANLLLAVTLLPLTLVNTPAMLPVVYLVAFIQSCIGQFFGPAENALLPMLVSQEELVSANSLNSLNNNLARLIGPALGGFAAAWLGLGGIALLDAASFVIAALLIACIRVDPALHVPAPSAEETPRRSPGALGFFGEWIAGLRLVRQSPVVLLLFTMVALMAIGEGVLAVLFVPFVTQVLGGEAITLGWLMSAQAIGGLLGGVIIAQLGSRFAPARMLGPATIVFGLIDLAIFNYSAFFPGIAIALGLFILVGLPAAAVGACFHTLIQKSVADNYLGRIFGAYTTTFSLLTLSGMAFASLMGDVLGIVPVISLQGAMPILAGLLALFLLPRLFRESENAAITETPLASPAP